MSSITTTIELGDFEVEVEIDYEAIPGEPMVWRDRNGHGYPGSPPYADLQDVTVLFQGETKRGESHDSPNRWDELDKLAYKYVEDNWKRFGDMCLEDAALRDEAAQDEANEAKYERWKNGD